MLCNVNRPKCGNRDMVPEKNAKFPLTDNLNNEEALKETETKRIILLRIKKRQLKVHLC